MLFMWQIIMRHLSRNPFCPFIYHIFMLQSLQGKQDSLIQRIDSLAEENEDLRGQVADLHDEKDGMEEKLREARAEHRHLEGKIDKYEVSLSRYVMNSTQVIDSEVAI